MLSGADLLAMHCTPQKSAMTDSQIAAHLSALDGWSLQNGAIEKDFQLRDFHQVMDFVNGVAVIVNEQDHHPEMTLGYKHCLIRFHTHSMNEGRGGISVNDFICAAKIDHLAGSVSR